MPSKFLRAVVTLDTPDYTNWPRVEIEITHEDGQSGWQAQFTIFTRVYSDGSWQAPSMIASPAGGLYVGQLDSLSRSMKRFWHGLDKLNNAAGHTLDVRSIVRRVLAVTKLREVELTATKLTRDVLLERNWDVLLGERVKMTPEGLHTTFGVCLQRTVEKQPDQE